MNFFHFIYELLIGQFIYVSNREYFNISTANIVRITEGNVKLHAFKPLSYVVSSYIVELPTKLVIFNLQVLETDAQNFLEYAQSLKKPIEKCILSHYHFDHWVGAKVFKNITTVYALNETIEQIRQFYTLGRENAFQNDALDLLTHIKPMSVTGEKIDGVQFYYEKIFGAENPITMITRLPDQKTLISGDLVYNKFHNYVGEVKDFRIWLSILRYFQKAYPYRNVLLGHGDPGNATSYEETIEYLEFVRNVASTFKTLPEYRQSITNKYPTYLNVPIVNCPFTNSSCPYGIW